MTMDLLSRFGLKRAGGRSVNRENGAGRFDLGGDIMDEASRLASDMNSWMEENTLLASVKTGTRTQPASEADRLEKAVMTGKSIGAAEEGDVDSTEELGGTTYAAADAELATLPDTEEGLKADEDDSQSLSRDLTLEGDTTRGDALDGTFDSSTDTIESSGSSVKKRNNAVSATPSNLMDAEVVYTGVEGLFSEKNMAKHRANAVATAPDHRVDSTFDSGGSFNVFNVLAAPAVLMEGDESVGGDTTSSYADTLGDSLATDAPSYMIESLIPFVTQESNIGNDGDSTSRQDSNLDESTVEKDEGSFMREELGEEQYIFRGDANSAMSVPPKEDAVHHRTTEEVGEEVTLERANRTRSALVQEEVNDHADALEVQIDMSTVGRDASRISRVSELLDEIYGHSSVGRERSQLRASKVLVRYEGMENILLEVLEEKAAAKRRPSWSGRSVMSVGSLRSLMSSTSDKRRHEERSACSHQAKTLGAGRSAAAVATATAVAVRAISPTENAQQTRTVSPAKATKQNEERVDENKQRKKKKKMRMLHCLKKKVSRRLKSQSVAKMITKEVAEAGPRAEIRMISGSQDAQTSSDVQNISSFLLPDPAGRSGGACTSALLKVLYSDKNRPESDLSFVDVLMKMREELSKKGFDQIPQLTASRPIDLEAPFCLVQPLKGAKDGGSSSTARALLIGINYTGKNGSLSGCHNDVRNMKDYLEDVHGFSEGNITVLMDDGKHTEPTRANILAAYKEIVEKCKAGDSVFCQFSGHGVKVRDENQSEEDYGSDETICPVDYSDAGHIREDDIYDTFIHPMPPGVTVTCLIDCCHSGTVLDLPYKFKAGSGSKSMVMDSEYRSGKFLSATANAKAVNEQDCLTEPTSRMDMASKPTSVFASPNTFVTAELVSDSSETSSDASFREKMKECIETERSVESQLSYALSFDSAPGIGAGEVTSFDGVAKFLDMVSNDNELQDEELHAHPNERQRTPSFVATPRVDPVAIGLLPNSDKVEVDEAFEVDISNRIRGPSGEITFDDYSEESDEGEPVKEDKASTPEKKTGCFSKLSLRCH